MPRARSSRRRGWLRSRASSRPRRGRAAVRCARSRRVPATAFVPDRAVVPPPLTTCQGGVVREPIVNDSRIVALKLKWIVKKMILMLTLTRTPASIWIWIAS